MIPKAEWSLTFTEDVRKELKKLPKQASNKIITYLENRVLSSASPKNLGKPLSSNLKGLWSYRIEDYRIICEILDEELVVLVVRVGHRKNVYKMTAH